MVPSLPVIGLCNWPVAASDDGLAKQRWMPVYIYIYSSRAAIP